MRMAWWRKVLLPVLLSGSMATAATLPGRIDGSFEASASGAVTYSIPVTVATGMNGLRPAIGLEYNSQSARGDAGAGWSLSGFSMISRCPLTMALDGRMQGVRYSRQDRFCLDGQPLVLISAVPGVNGAQYRSELHAYEVVTIVGTLGTGPLSFELRRPDGLVYRYGNDADSRVEAPGTGEVRAWALNEVEDRFGQRMAFQYQEDAVAGEHYPAEILWTYGAGETPAQARYRLAFTWEPRPAEDQRSGYTWGSPWRESRRLAAIEYLHNAGSGFTRVHRYGLTYATPVPGGTRRSRLVSISQCGPRDCLPPTTFQWDDGTATRAASSLPAVPVDGAVPGDFNGDGATDLYGAWQGHWAVWPADPQAGGFRAPVVVGGSITEDSVGLPIDYNGDGLVDLMVASSQGPNWLVYQAPTVPGDAFSVRNTGIALSAGVEVAPLDMDGDGFEDIVYLRDIQAYYRRNSGGAFEAEKSAGLAAVPAANRLPQGTPVLLETGDFDGDGRGDLLVARSTAVPGGGGYRWEAFLSNGFGFGPDPIATFTTEAAPGKLLVLDLNGDGLADVLRHAEGAWNSLLSHGTSAGGLPGLVPQSCLAPAGSGDQGQAAVLDYDGDGRSDLVLGNASGGWKVHLSVGDCLDSDGQAIDAALPQSGGINRLLVVDADSDGSADLLLGSTTQPGWSLLRYLPPPGPDGGPGAPRPELMRQLNDGLGNGMSFRFQALGQVPGYRMSGSNPAGAIALHGGALPVIVGYTVTGASRYEVSLGYSGARRDRQGRGFLGFETVTAVDSRNGLKSVTQFRQDFPFIGRIELATTWDQDRKVSVFDPSWAMAAGPPAMVLNTRFVYLAGDLTETYEVDAEGGLQGSLVRSVRRTLSWNLVHGAVSREVTEVTSPLDPGRSHRTTRNYSFDDVAAGAGCLGLPTRIDSTREVTGTATRSGSLLMTYSSATCRLLSELDGTASSSTQQLRTSYAYDAAGRTTSVTRSDAAGQLAARITRFSYAPGGSRPLTESQVISGEPDYVVGHAWNDALGLETGRSEPQGFISGWQYDDFGRIRLETRSTGSTTFSYSACGPCFAAGARYALRQTRSDGYWSETQHDGAGQVLGQAFVLVDGRTSRQLFEYDSLGRLRRQSAPFLADASTVYWTTITHDLLGRPRSIDQPYSEAVPSGIESAFVYAGLDTTARNAAGYETVVRRDAAGRVTRVTGLLGSTVTYAYDALDRLTGVFDAGGHSRQFSHDERGLLVESVDPDSGRRSFAYDAFGQLVRQSDGKLPANVMTLQYDQLGRLVRRVEPEGTTSWTFVAAGAGRGLPQLVTAPTDRGPAGFQEAYLYDSKGQLQRTTTTIDGSSYETDYSYGVEGRLETMTYPTTVGWRPQFHFNYAFGHVKAITQESLGLNTVYTLLEMDARGRDSWSSFGSDEIAERNIYDRATGRLAEIRSGPFMVPTALQFYTYEWDVVGNLLARHNRRTSPVQSERFTYDALNRLIQASLNGTRTVGMTYSADGNIRSRSDVGSYSYGTGTQPPHGVVAVSGGPRGSMSFAYDANGNMTSRNGTTLAWTSFNLPRQLSRGVDFARFTYGPDRTRIAQETKTGATQKTIHYVGPHFEVEMEGSSKRYRATVFAHGRAVYSQLESTPNGLEAYYVLHDHAGSVDRLVRAAGAGANIFTLSFDAWGKRRNSNWSVDAGDQRYGDTHWVERGYTGHEHIDNMQLIHMNGRLQDPILGRMLAPDPVLAGMLDPQVLNPYSYAANNPASYFDPSGYLFSKLRKVIRRGVRHIGHFGQRLVRNWGRPIVAAVAAFYTAGAVSSWAYAAQLPAAGAAAGTAGGVATANTLAGAAFSSAVLGGAAGGAVAGAITTGNLRGVAAGAITGGLMGGIGVQFGSSYSAGRVLAESTVGGIGAELQGGDFRNGFLTSGTFSTLTWAAVEMRRVMVEQSRLNPENATGISDGFRGDRFKLGGCRSPCNGSPLGGMQRGPGRFFSMDYNPGSFLDHLVETYAGPHDFLNSPVFYDNFGNNIGRSSLFNALNAGNVVLATPFAIASIVPTYAYGALGD